MRLPWRSGSMRLPSSSSSWELPSLLGCTNFNMNSEHYFGAPMIHARLTCSKNDGSCTCSCQLRLAASAVTSESRSFLFLAADNGHCNSQQQDLEYVTRSARHPRQGVLKSSIRNHNRHNSAIEETVNRLWQLSFEARSEIYPCDVFLGGDQWRLAKFWNLNSNCWCVQDLATYPKLALFDRKNRDLYMYSIFLKNKKI